MIYSAKLLYVLNTLGIISNYRTCSENPSFFVFGTGDRARWALFIPSRTADPTGTLVHIGIEGNDAKSGGGKAELFINRFQLAHSSARLFEGHRFCKQRNFPPGYWYGSHLCRRSFVTSRFTPLQHGRSSWMITLRRIVGRYQKSCHRQAIFCVWGYYQKVLGGQVQHHCITL